jgi:hypothetical protein
MSYLVSASDGSLTGIQSIGNISYSIGSNLATNNVVRDSDTFTISSISGNYEERFDDQDYTGNPTSQDIQNVTGAFTGVQNLGSIVYGIGNSNIINEDFVNQTKNISDLTGLYTERFDDETYYQTLI